VKQPTKERIPLKSIAKVILIIEETRIIKGKCGDFFSLYVEGEDA